MRYLKINCYDKKVEGKAFEQMHRVAQERGECKGGESDSEGTDWFYRLEGYFNPIPQGWMPTRQEDRGA